eukprot:PhM_4_TR11371/c0_g1_i1/m.28930
MKPAVLPPPTFEEVYNYAISLGMDPEGLDEKLMFIAQEGYVDELPADWSVFQDEDDHYFFYNASTGVSVWDRPVNVEHQERLHEERKRLAREECDALYEKELSNLKADHAVKLSQEREHLGRQHEAVMMIQRQAFEERKISQQKEFDTEIQVIKSKIETQISQQREALEIQFRDKMEAIEKDFEKKVDIERKSHEQRIAAELKSLQTKRLSQSNEKALLDITGMRDAFMAEYTALLTQLKTKAQSVIDDMDRSAKKQKEAVATRTTSSGWRYPSLILWSLALVLIVRMMSRRGWI